MKKRSVYEFKEFNVLDYVEDEEDAVYFFEAASIEQEGMNTPRRVERAWEVVNQASQRHGFPITPAIHDAYAAARVAAAEHPGTPERQNKRTKTRAAVTPKPAIA